MTSRLLYLIHKTTKIFEFIQNNLLFEDKLKLLIPVHSYIQPSTQHQFILHLLLSLGRYKTEIDLVQHASLRDAFRYAKLIGNNNDKESLLKYNDNIFVCFIEKQLVYFPNSRQIIDTWIQSTGELLDEVIINDNIPITEMPSVQLTSILKSVNAKCVSVINKLKKDVVSSTLKELDGSSEACNIPCLNDFLEATKSSPLEWNACHNLTQTSNQPYKSFTEKYFAIKTCAEAIENYSNIR